MALFNNGPSQPMNFPKRLTNADQQFQLTGASRIVGGCQYLIFGSNGVFIDVLPAEVTLTGSNFVEVCCTTNQALYQVRVPVDKAWLPGTKVLVGDFVYGKDGSISARYLWPRTAANVGNTPRRQSGVITKVCDSGCYGFIRSERGKDFFVHKTELAPGTHLREGVKVTFVPSAGNSRGGAAKQVQLT